ncbi:type III effector HrpK domain-containing protein [Pseudomonas rhizophila]|uniref:Type III effector HrpK n=1 Tax=Pseudomonas rhizophila TaxID=2045200 RepID=A0ABN5JYR9_9PSED|nr:type III effector HrpK domain-containing protein [Pseudomonas rhizophila]AVU77315.1 type III effector HrpK [Pseudomonas rhizophila]
MSVQDVSFVGITSKPQDPKLAEAWDQAIKQAKDAGIEWERPKGDDRSAQDIINDTPVLKNLGNQSDVKDNLKDRVGDFETDPDAAYRAKQVLEHVEKYDEGGERIASKDIDNGRVDGFTKGGDAKHGTEAGRLQDFGRQGFSHLKGELKDLSKPGDDPKVREQAEALGIKWERPEGDDRSAQDIIDGNALLKNLGNQSSVRDMLKEQVGDFENDPDAAYRATQVLEHIETLNGEGGKIAGKDVGNGRVDGFTKSGEAKHDTEAGRLQDFGKMGFSALKGEIKDSSSAGDNKEAREQAEKVGIVWKRPEEDKRSAQDIIEDNPLLKNLGNQSGVKDMLKDQVGDYENDADAAYRAAQVLDRITMFDDKGNAQSGGDVFNSSVDGFTKSGEAKHGTEAGRLQDFGKGGFSTLPELKKTDDIASYKDYLKTNKDADPASQQIAKYAAILDENFEAIKGKTGAGKYLTADDIKEYRNQNSQLSEETKQALDFWSQPGAFKVIDNAKNPLDKNPDGELSRGDVQGWLKSANVPKDATSVTALLSGIAGNNALARVDTAGLNKDVFDHPEKYSAEEKAAVLQDLKAAQQLIIQGSAAGMWRDDKSQVTIANKVRSHPDAQKLLDDVNKHIGILESDPAVSQYMSEHGSSELTKLVEDNKGLKESLQKTYDDEIKSGKSLDTLWETKSKDGKTTHTEILAEFFGTAQTLQGALGINNAGEIQAAVKGSKANAELESFYEKSLASGDRLNELLKEHTPHEAMSAFSLEVALYNSALDPEFTGKFDTQLNDNFTRIAKDNAFKDASFDDMKAAFGVNGGSELDEEKVKKIIEQISKENPQMLVNADGTVATPDQILANFRGDWDLLRQGTKTLDALDVFSKDSSIKDAANKGVLHGVSGLFMAGVTIAKGANNAGKLTERQIVDIATGSVQAATLLAEGGLKNYQDYLKDVKGKLTGDRLGDLGKKLDDPLKSVTANLKGMENAAKGIGGIAAITAGAYGIFDGVKALRKGDTVSGGMNITAGSLGIMAGLASVAEVGASAMSVSAIAASRISMIAGGLGFAAAGVAALALLVPGLIEEGKQETRVGKFSDALSDYLTQYEIDGVPQGDIWDIPYEEWPGEDSTIAS